MAHGLGCIELTDRIKTGIGTKLIIHQRIVVTNGSIVILLCPVAGVIHLSANLQEAMLILASFQFCERLFLHSLRKNLLNLSIGVWLIIEFLDTMVAQTAAHFMEEIVTLLKRIHHILEGGNRHTSNLTKLINIVGKVGLLDIHSLVGTPGRNHASILLAFSLGIFNMIVEIIDGIICRAYGLNMIATHKTACGIFGIILQFVITLVEDFTGCLWRKKFCNAKACLQLQVCPMIQGIAEGVRNGLSPLLKLFPVRSILTSAITLVNAIGTHSTPLVVVPSEP